MRSPIGRRRSIATCCSGSRRESGARSYPVPPPTAARSIRSTRTARCVYRKNGTLVFAIPSHNGFKPVLDSLVARHRAELSVGGPAHHRPARERGWRLVHDEQPRAVRVAEGGADRIPFPTDKPLMFSSDDQITYARRAFGVGHDGVRARARGSTAREPGRAGAVNDPAEHVVPGLTRATGWCRADRARVGVLFLSA